MINFKPRNTTVNGEYPAVFCVNDATESKRKDVKC